LLLGLVMVVLSGCAPPGAEQKLSVALRRFVDADRNARVRVLVDLKPQLDLQKLTSRLETARLTRVARRDSVIAALRAVADSSGVRLAPLLEDLIRHGEIDPQYRRFTIVNRLLVRASPAAVRALSRRREVVRLVEERRDPNPMLMSRTPAVIQSTGRGSWALAAIGAERAWRRRVDGSGVVIGIIDAGASGAHEQLRPNYRGGSAAWYDPTGASAIPVDGLDGHGTGMVSAAVGANVAGRTIGVAPSAQWIACVGIPRGRYDNVALTECADWMLVTGRPDVLLNAWALPGSGCDREWERILAAWRAAGMVPVFAAGNYGPAPSSDRSPANNRGAIAVGGIGLDGLVLDQSSRGPNSCDGTAYPGVMAPGDNVTVAHSLAPNAYAVSRGTSVAAGLVAGAAALLIQRYPEATVDEFEAALGSRLNIPAALDSLAMLLQRRRATPPRR
jgi:subtilisin family serine protease